jgi:hypothetical protein
MVPEVLDVGDHGHLPGLLDSLAELALKTQKQQEKRRH